MVQPTLLAVDLAAALRVTSALCPLLRLPGLLVRVEALLGEAAEV